MADAHTAAKALLLAAGRDTSVASVAGVGSVEWATRVQPGDKNGFIAGLHRGRLPAVEVFQKSDTWTLLSADEGGQGTMSATWTARVHSGLPDQDLAEDQVRAIIYAMLIKVRANRYFTIGDDIISNFSESPLGYALEVEMTVVTAMGRDTYETSADTTPGTIPDGGAVGGISFDVNFNDTSPVSILALPAGQAINGVQVKVLTTFDGASPSVTVGVTGDQSRYMAAADSDVAQAGTVWEQDADDPGPQTVKVWITPGAGATQGKVRVQITATASA